MSRRLRRKAKSTSASSNLGSGRDCVTTEFKGKSLLKGAKSNIRCVGFERQGSGPNPPCSPEPDRTGGHQKSSRALKNVSHQDAGSREPALRANESGDEVAKPVSLIQSMGEGLNTNGCVEPQETVQNISQSVLDLFKKMEKM